jgi:PHD/YefM family antitoxin component YafN of YafNO toxin-antitoxin module
MIAYTRDEIISATDLARNLSATLNSIVKRSKEKIAIAKNNKLEAVIINIEEYERLKEASELMEHMEIAKILDERKDSKTISFDDLLERQGIDPNEL